jgi:hypothetical protein
MVSDVAPKGFFSAANAAGGGHAAQTGVQLESRRDAFRKGVAPID